MKLLAAVIAASAHARDHAGEHHQSTTTGQYPNPTMTTNYHMGHVDEDDHHMGSGDYNGSGDYYDDDDMGHGHHGKPDMGYGDGRPNMGCNHEAMKMWKMEMEKWKYQQEEWQREFRMWKMENGGDHYGPGDHNDHYGPEHGPNNDYNDHHYDDNYGHDMDMGGGFWDWDMDMSWMDGIWEMLGQEDVLCPIFGMIPFDPSWGVGSGADWEAGCRDNFRMQRQYEQLIMQAGGMKSKEFAEQWCYLMKEDAGKQLEMFGLGMFAEAAMPMCKCVTATVKDIVDGNMGMEMMANVGQCVGEVQGFIGMFMEMDMDVKVNIDIDYSEENIQKAIEEFLNSDLADINVMDESILTLLRYWDMEGTFKKMGIFEDDVDINNIYSALAIVNIYNKNYEEDWSLEHFGYILRNAADWVSYYDNSRTIFSHIFRQQNPMADDMAVEAYLAENFQKVYAEPTHIDEFLQNSGFNISSLAEKAQFVSGQPTDVVNFEELMNAVLNGDHWDMQPYIALGQAYIDYLLDDKEPQFPGFMWGLLNCLDMEDIQAWSSSDNLDEVRNAWNQGVALKYMDTSSEFFMCMMPFNDMAVEWDSAKNMTSMDSMMEMAV